jgi:lipoprotein signal peptidase
VLSAVLLLAVLGLALLRSMAVALAGGVMSGGILGNLVSARADRNRVPNPLLIGGFGHGVAFNLADVFFLAGDVLLVLALIHVLRRKRGRLTCRSVG